MIFDEDDDDNIKTKTEEIIINKNGMLMKKMGKNIYSLDFSFQNHMIDLRKILNFHLMTLLYEINKDTVFERQNLEIFNEEQARFYIVFKHFFPDYGFPHYFCHLNVEKKVENDGKNVSFSTTNSYVYDNHNHDRNIKLLELKNFLLVSEVDDTAHNVSFKINIIMEDGQFPITHFIEKMIGIIVSKIFYRIKLFIENITNI